MPKNTQLSNAVVNQQADALATRLNNGFVRIYTGAQPASADAAITTQTLLAELRFAATAAPAAVAGLLTFNAIAPVNASGTGTAVWFRCFQSDGTTVVMDGNVDVAANTPNMTLNATTLVQNAQVSVSSFTHQVAKSAAGF